MEIQTWRKKMTDKDQENKSDNPRRNIAITTFLWAGIILHASIALIYIPGLVYSIQNPEKILELLGPSYKEFMDQSVWKHVIFLIIDLGLCFFAWELNNWKRRGFYGLFSLFMLIIGMSLEKENWHVLLSDLSLVIIFSWYYIKEDKRLD
jgi:FtsH-binding integral membrane protein